jgi:hypothetical protein
MGFPNGETCIDIVRHRIVDRQAHEPTKQKVVVQRLHQHPLAADRIQNLQE